MKSRRRGRRSSSLLPRVSLFHPASILPPLHFAPPLPLPPARLPAPDVESLQGLWPYRRSAAAATGQRSCISKDSASLCYWQVFKNIVQLQKSLISQVPLSEAEPLRRRGCIILNSCLVVSSPFPPAESSFDWETENMQCQV